MAPSHPEDRSRSGRTLGRFIQSIADDLQDVSRDVRILLVGQFLMNASNFTAFPLMAVYMADHLGLSASEIGAVLTIHLAAGKALPIVTGPLADRFGFRPLIVIGLALRAFGFAGFSIFASPLSIAISTLTIGIGTTFYESAIYGIFGRQPQKIVARVFVLNNLALNLGVILGPMLGAALLLFDPAYPFQASAVLFACLALWSVRFHHLDSLYISRSAITDSWRAVVTDRDFLIFLSATLAWWFLFSQLFVLSPS